MCELMAMSFEAPISADFSLREFAARGEENPDGWGLGWYPDRSLAIVKEPLKWASSRYAGFLEIYPTLLSRTLPGPRPPQDDGRRAHPRRHPPVRPRDGRARLLLRPQRDARRPRLGPAPRAVPTRSATPTRSGSSATSSPRSTGRGGHLDDPDDWRWLHETLAAANRFGKLNVLLSDGHRLFVYHDVNGWKGLNFRKVRLREGEPRHFGDETLAVDLDGRGGQPRLRGRDLPAQPDRLASVPARRADRLRRRRDPVFEPSRAGLGRVLPGRAARATSKPDGLADRDGSAKPSPWPPGRLWRPGSAGRAGR